MHVRLRSRVAFIKLRNQSTYCYANASFLSMMWAIMTRAQFALDDIGQLALPLVEMLLCLEDGALTLASIPCLTQLMRNWKNIGEHAATADAAEFSLFLMGYFLTSTPDVDLHWERREEEDGCIHAKDKSEQSSPTILRLTREMLHQESVALQSLIDTWRQVDGRVTAFMQCSQLQCLQLQRHIETDRGIQQFNQPVTFEEPMQLPIFEPNSLEYRMEPYLVISAACHEGTSAHGHYQSLLRTRTSPSEWFVKDDGHSIVATDTVPTWCERGASILWLRHITQWIAFNGEALTDAIHDCSDPDFL